MEKIEIKQTTNTPYFLVDFEKGYICYKGRFIPMISPQELAKELKEAVKEYTNRAKPETTIEVWFEIVNTANSKLFFEIFKEIKAIEKTGSKLTCLWHIEDKEDEDRIDMAQDVKQIAGLDFQLIDDSIE